MKILGPIAISVLGGLILIGLSREIGSAFIMDFLRANLLLLLPALMAINVATAGVVMTKLKELREKHGIDFDSTIQGMKSSFHEQTALMLIAAVLLIGEGSRSLNWFHDNLALRHDIRFVVESLICGCFIYALLILHDTAKSIFVILNFENQQSPQDNAPPRS